MLLVKSNHMLIRILKRVQSINTQENRNVTRVVKLLIWDKFYFLNFLKNKHLISIPVELERYYDNFPAIS